MDSERSQERFDAMLPAMRSSTPTEPLPRAMQQHTYAIMSAVESSHWWFVGRRRILGTMVEQALARLAPRPPVPRILDLGCGTGGNLMFLKDFGRAEGVDISEEALAFCRMRGLTQVKLGAAESLPYPPETFDLVTALDVIEHLDDDVGSMREMARVLRPGGSALFFVPAFSWLWGVQDDVSNHRRRYTLAELTDHVRAAGLHVERATYANVTFFLPILLGRAVMKLTGLRPASENNLNVNALNGLFGAVLGSERHWLAKHSFPIGVSAICLASKA